MTEKDVTSPNILESLRNALGKSRDKIFGSLQDLFGIEAIDEDTLDDIEETLYSADIGVHAAEKIVEELSERRQDIRSGHTTPFEVIRDVLLGMIVLDDNNQAKLTIGDSRPWVILVAGVNGVGKTTTIGKLAMRLKNQGYSVLISACDTYRTAAVEQLAVWAKRADCDFIGAQEGADAASVAYDTMQRARSRNDDVVLIDTAGRLHTSKNLMEELKKIKRVIGKEQPGLPQEILMVLDAGTGQNAVNQAETFHEALGITGFVITKLDGTAKGGIVVSVIDRLGVPVKLIGVGEGIEDLKDFDPEAFIDALFMPRET